MPDNRVVVDDPKDIIGVDEARVYAALAYLFILVIAPLAQYKQDPFVNFHIRQGLILSAGFILAGMMAAWWISSLGALLFVLLLMLDTVAMVLALQGRKWKVPLIGSLAEKIVI